jgi:hypothetical protein
VTDAPVPALLLAATAAGDADMPWWSWLLFLPVFLGILLLSVRTATRNLMDWHQRHAEQWPYRRP